LTPQKNLENDFWGLTNATEETKLMMLLYGQDGLHLDGHSRGSMTIGNALESIARMPGADGSLSNTTISFFGPAYNAAAADALLSTLQGYNGVSDPSRPNDTVLTLQNHIADPVGRLIGGNPATGGTIPVGTTLLEQMIRAATGQKDTSHNCYGAPSPDGNCGAMWKGLPSDQAISYPINQLMKVDANK
jgi:filamentous hemagglutinin